MHLFIRLPFIGQAWVQTEPPHPTAPLFLDHWKDGGETFLAFFRGRLRLIFTPSSVLRGYQVRSRAPATV